MKVLVVSIEFGPPFQRDLMTALAARGHEVVFYTAGLTDLSNRLKLQWAKKDGIARAELWNSPARPATSDDPFVQIGNDDIDALTDEVIARVRPDVVHFHELSAHGISTMDVVSRRGVPSVVSLHNFWPLCPQLNLIDAAGGLCLDDGGGAKCTRCRWLPMAQGRTRVEWMKSALASTPFFEPLRRARGLMRRVAMNSGDVSASPVGWGESLFSAEAFGERRARAVAALNRTTIIHALSTRTADVLARHGVDAHRVAVRPISLYALDALTPVRRGPVTHPVTFGYRGLLSYQKGVHVLIAAFAHLDQRKARLLVYGTGEPHYQSALREMAKSLNVEFRGEYRRDELAEIDAGIDVGIVPSIWDETFCLTGMEFLRSGVPVIATAMGGMLDYVRHSENGLLVPPADAVALADAMRRLSESPAEIDALRSPTPPLSMDEVTSSMIALYEAAAA